MHRAFIDGPAAAGDEVPLHPDDAHHLHRVLRLRVGDVIWVSDGRGGEGRGTITRLDGRTGWVRVEDWRQSPAEPPLDVVLFQAVPKGDRMDWLIQKATELGVHTIVPLQTKRTVVKLPRGEAGAARQTRWQRIARESARQINRAWIPIVEEVHDFSAALETLPERGHGTPDWQAFIPWEERPDAGFIKKLQGRDKPKRVGLFIGPEGGWDPQEVAEAGRWGIEPVGLGPRVVRSETAGILALILTLTVWGDLG